MKVKNLSIFGEKRVVKCRKSALTKNQSSFHTLVLSIFLIQILSECVNSRHIHSSNQQMDIVGSFVGDN